MLDEQFAPEPESPRPESAPKPLRERALEGIARFWRPAGTGLMVTLALLLGWHVVNGKHGLSAWQQNRQEDKELRKEIQDLQQENDRLRVRVDKLRSDPNAIEHEAREKLHYAKPGEVIVDLPGEKPAQPVK
ncbi:septum formation initiator family protein [Acidobacteria bacterium AB60]|nr:septum formation initiator family protein [Acidobacteria bacterium AB60]